MASPIAFRPLLGWRERLRGLLFTDASTAGAVLLSPCRSIHTLGMAYPIDVAFISRDGLVLRARRAVPPGRALSCRKAASVLERPASGDEWPAEGERVSWALQRTRGEEEVRHHEG